MKTPFKQKFINTDPINNPNSSINLPEIKIKAHLKKNLTPQQLKVYNIFYKTKTKLKRNPSYNKSKPRSKENKRLIKVEEKEFAPTLKFRHNKGNRSEIHVSDAMQLVKDSKVENIYNEPSFISKMFPKTMNIDKDNKNFRAHSGGTKSIGSKNIYVPPNNMTAVIAELSHIFPGISHDPSVKGTVSRFKRVLTGKGGDKSNYKDPNDFEYKTHSGPNSTESKIIKKYANKWGKF
tara:strand:+ start:61 stop:765 length:705 start_codon:yes stop_codon:yes gene_type:complete